MSTPLPGRPSIVTDRLVVPEPACVVLVGSCGAGKTSLARLVWADRVVDVEAHRRACGLANVRAGFVAAYTELRHRLARGDSAVFDSTGVTERVRATLQDIAAGAGVPAVVVCIDTPAAIAHARNASRPEPVPDDVMIGIREEFERARGLVLLEHWHAVCVLTPAFDATDYVVG